MSKPLIVTFWGTRGNLAVPGIATRVYGGNTPCVEITNGEAIFVCDAGSGLRGLGEVLKQRTPAPAEAHLFLSHAHWDHVEGLPFLDPASLPQQTLHIHATQKDQERVRQLLADETGMGWFPAHLKGRHCRTVLHDLPAETREVCGVSVRAFPLNHPGGCSGFSFTQNGRKVVYAPDHELPIQPGDKFPDPHHESLLMRKMPVELLEIARAADLLILDGQYDDDTYAMHIGQGHSSCISATDFALQADAKRLALFHHDPASSDFDLEDKVRKCSDRTAKFGVELPIFAAREGVSLKL